MTDETEQIRRQMVQEINENAGCREELEAKHGQVWSTAELQQDYEVLGFMAPLVIVLRKADGAKGSLEFQHNPRFYFNFR